MKKKLKKWLLGIFKVLILLGFGLAGIVVGIFIFGVDDIAFVDDQTGIEIPNYFSETLSLDSSRIMRNLSQKKKRPYTGYNLFDPELTARVDKFITGYNAGNNNDKDKLEIWKQEVDYLLSRIHKHIKGFYGKDLSKEDKQHYLALYHLRDIDREIVRKQLVWNPDALTFFQKPEKFHASNGKWIFQIQEPTTNHFHRYYESIKSSELINEIFERINEIFLFDKEYYATILECENEAGPIYDRKTRNISICYKQIEVLEKIFYEELKTEKEIFSEVTNILAMVLLREFGHLIHDIYSIPYSGKMETTVDQLAVILAAEVIAIDWDNVQDITMAYAKALYRIHEMKVAEMKKKEEEESAKAISESEWINNEKLSNYLLILNDFYDNAPLLGKQRFYSILYMVIGYRAELFSPYVTFHGEYDRQTDNIYPDFLWKNPRDYLKSSNYWYNSVMPYFRLEFRDGQ